MSELKTYGDLKKLINGVIKNQKGEKILSKGKEIAIDQVLGFIPGASNAKSLFDLVEYWHFIGGCNGRMYSCKKVAADWRRLIKRLIKEEEPEPLDCEYETPQEMGWVGKDGRP